MAKLLRWAASICRATRGFQLFELKPEGGHLQLAWYWSRASLVALFAAAEALGFKFVPGTQPHLYIERLDRKVFRELGLSLEVANHQADVFVRVPKNPEAVFRATVEREGVPATDILQVWLDVSNDPARGKDQADLLRKRVFSQILSKANA